MLSESEESEDWSVEGYDSIASDPTAYGAFNSSYDASKILIIPPCASASSPLGSELDVQSISGVSKDCAQVILEATIVSSSSVDESLIDLSRIYAFVPYIGNNKTKMSSQFIL